MKTLSKRGERHIATSFLPIQHVLGEGQTTTSTGMPTVLKSPTDVPPSTDEDKKLWATQCSPEYNRQETRRHEACMQQPKSSIIAPAPRGVHSRVHIDSAISRRLFFTERPVRVGLIYAPRRRRNAQYETTIRAAKTLICLVLCYVEVDSSAVGRLLESRSGNEGLDIKPTTLVTTDAMITFGTDGLMCSSRYGVSCLIRPRINSLVKATVVRIKRGNFLFEGPYVIYQLLLCEPKSLTGNRYRHVIIEQENDYVTSDFTQNSSRSLSGLSGADISGAYTPKIKIHISPILTRSQRSLGFTHPKPFTYSDNFSDRMKSTPGHLHWL
ncbi:hypothetical protein EVAR_13738_1 [Eumeta japonica]|uniref:Uncharacterized protein n=1 Tax=Eumeta variegata TaxID=151549 RepID=A0A4C1UBI9_EUMVA|nr:hypothetical protein EVAR_13738_1 [Eumeta japonica]